MTTPGWYAKGDKGDPGPAGPASGTGDSIVLTPTGVAATDGPAMDAAIVTAKAEKRPIVLKSGIFRRSTAWDLRDSLSLIIDGHGYTSTVIECTTDTADLLLVGGFGHYLSNFQIRHANTPTGTTGNGIVFHKSAFSKFDHIAVYNAKNLVYIAPQDVHDPTTSSGTGNWMFSNTFEDIQLHNYANSAIYLHPHNAGSTGSVWNNTYIENGFPGSPLGSTSNPLDLQDVNESVFNQLNIEDHTGVNLAILLNNSNATFNSVHFERLPLTGWQPSYIRAYGNSSITVNGMTLGFSDVQTSGAGNYSTLFSVGLGGAIDAKGIWIMDCTKTLALPWRWVESDDTNANNAVTIATPMVKVGSPAFTSPTTSDHTKGIKRLGSTLYGTTLSAPVGQPTPIVLTPTGVTATDTAAMDSAVTTALADKRAIVMKAGTFQRSTPWDLRGTGLHVCGAGPGNTVIKQMTTNTAGIKIGHLYQNISDFTVQNNAQSPSTDTAANGIEFYKAGFCTYSRINTELFARGLYIAQANYDATAAGLGATGNWVFSNIFNSMKVSGFAIIGISMITFGGGSAGNVWNNTYVNNNWTGTIATCTEDMMRFGNTDEIVFNQVNLESCDVPNYDVLSFASCGGVTIRGLHFEQLTVGQFNAAFVVPYDSRISISGLVMSACTLTNSGTHAVTKLATALDSIEIVGFRQHDMTVAGTWVLVHGSSATAGATAWFRQCDVVTGADLFSAVKSDLAFPNLPVVKQINDTIYTHKNAAGKNVIYGTAAPTTLTWAVGDTCWNTAPAAGGTPGWVCTGAGTPGTWKAMASVAA